jgi:peroxiredoxin
MENGRTMDTINVGPLLLKRDMLEWILAAAVGFSLMRLRMKGTATGARIGSQLLNALLCGIVVWKGSLLLFSPMEVIRQPMSLLYFTGGARGAWLGTAAALAYVWLQARKEERTSRPQYIDSTLFFILCGYSTKLLLDVLSGGEHMLRDGLIVLLAVLVGSLWLRQVAPGQLKGAAQLAVMFLVGSALIVSFAANLWEKPDASQSSEAGYGLNIGQQAPDFEVQNLEGKPVKLSDYRGKTVVLNFWATWCPPCRAEMPHMERFHEQYHDDVVVLGMNATTTEASPNVVEAWVKEWGLQFPIVLDSQGKVIEAYRINSYPTTYVMDAEGKVIYRYQGPMNFDMLKEATRK